MTNGGPRLGDEDYRRLLAFRTTLREFVRWSESLARDAGLATAQHQLLLVVRGHPDNRGPTIQDIAEYLFLRHHSAVELVDRAVAAGLVQRGQDPDDRRVARLHLTTKGRQLLERITLKHIEEVTRFEEAMKGLWTLGRPNPFAP